jgi:hypothetical protein
VCIGICTTPWGNGSGGEGHFCVIGVCTTAFEMCTEICIPALLPTNGVPTPNNDGSQSGGGGGGGSYNGGVIIYNGTGTNPTLPPITPDQTNENGASNDNEVLVLPVFTLEAEEDLGPETPCDNLTQKSNDPMFKNQFNALNVPANFQTDHETGFAESRHPNNNAQTTYTPLTSKHSTHTLDIPTNINAVSFAHVHNDDYIENGVVHKTIKMLAVKDLYTVAVTMKENAQTLNVPIEDTYGMMLSSEGIYAIKITDVTSDFTTIEWNKLIAKYNKSVNILAEDDNLNPTALKIMLLNLMKDFGLYDKMQLFEGTANSASTIPTWKKVELKANNKSLNYIPC